MNVCVPDERFSIISVDLVGPLPPSRGYRYLLTIMDRSTRFPHAIPLTDITAKSVAEAFFVHWIPFFGVPVQIVSDRGAQFSGSLWANMCE